MRYGAKVKLINPQPTLWTHALVSFRSLSRLNSNKNLRIEFINLKRIPQSGCRRLLSLRKRLTNENFNAVVGRRRRLGFVEFPVDRKSMCASALNLLSQTLCYDVITTSATMYLLDHESVVYNLTMFLLWLRQRNMRFLSNRRYIRIVNVNVSLKIRYEIF